MGEAKRRGSAVERARQAKERREVSVSELIKDFELPSDSKFLGYVIYSKDQDDYLAKIDEQTDRISRAYAKTPEAAIVFDDYAEVCRVAEGISRKTLIGILFDVGEKLFVAFDEE